MPDTVLGWLRATAEIVDPGNPMNRNDNEPGYMARIADGMAAVTQRSRVLYTASAADATVTGANARLPMLPAAVSGGANSFLVPAGAMPVGAHIFLIGTGTIGARSVTPPGFNLVPWVQPAGGSKTDLAGFAQAPLLGTDGHCEIWMKFTQTSGGLRTAGVVRYYANMSGGAMAYSIPINPGGTGGAGALPSITASDPAVDRTIGVDGFWGSGADTREYVRCRAVTATLFLP